MRRVGVGIPQGIVDQGTASAQMVRPRSLSPHPGGRMRFAALAILSLVTAAQTAQPGMSDAEVAQFEAEVMDVMNELMVAWNDEDGPGSLAPFDADALHVVWGTAVDDTPEAFGDRIAESWERVPSWEGDWEYAFVRAINPSSAVFLGRYEATLSYADGRSFFWQPHWTALLERDADEWKITVVDHSLGEGNLVAES